MRLVFTFVEAKPNTVIRLHEYYSLFVMYNGVCSYITGYGTHLCGGCNNAIICI